MRTRCLLLLIISSASLFGSIESIARKCQAHLIVGDAKSAVLQAKLGLQSYPQEPLAYEWVVKSLAASGEDFEMMQVWESYHRLFPELATQIDLLEEMCWSILNKGRAATGFNSQLIALIAAGLTQDMRAISFLVDGMRHTNAAIRSLAVDLAAYYGDHPLRVEIGRLFRQESILDVRVKVIEALGKLKMEDFFPDLIQCIAHPNTGPKEKCAAIHAVVAMKACVSTKELEALSKNRSAGLREVACEVIASCELKEESDLLLHLMEDSHPEVCAAAIKAWGVLRKKTTPTMKRIAMEAKDPWVGITAAWAWMIDEPIEAENVMVQWLEHPRAEVRAIAAAAVAAAGPYGAKVAKKIVAQSDDHFVKINLAIALARLHEECSEVCTILENALRENTEKWMKLEKGLFKAVVKGHVAHHPAIANYPEVVNQTVRLEILNLLAILESQHAMDAIKEFLRAKNWKVTGLAAETLLEEGDATAFDIVRKQLTDPDSEIRLEAALVLASWARDYSATKTLLDMYPNVDRQLKLKILESLGRIGDREAIPFLIERLKEPSLVLRMVAASILIQTLNC